MTTKELDACLLSIADGEQASLHALYDALYRPVFLLAASLSGDSQLAEDATQETFLVIRSCAPSYRAGANPQAWIYGITRNVTRELLRKGRYEQPHEDVGADAGSPGGPISFEKSCLDGIVVLEALHTLTSEEYRIVSLHVFGGFKLTEIARYLDMPYGTVLWRYSECKKKLRRFYAAQEDTPKEAGRHDG